LAKLVYRPLAEELGEVEDFLLKGWGQPVARFRGVVVII
jgi:hypothetical protein